MQTATFDEELGYDGSALRPRFIYEKTGILGNALVSFIGPCDVGEAHMVDLEDVRKSAWIKSEGMLHLLLEIFDCSLLAAVGVQRLLVDHLRQALEGLGVPGLRRAGDDLYDGIYKLTVSIAAPATTSCLIHVGLNISSRNTPVPTRGLDDYGISALDVIDRLVPAFIAEFLSMQRACYKVREL